MALSSFLPMSGLIFYEHIKKNPHLKSYHYLSFSASHPGLVLMKKCCDLESSPFRMLDDREWEPQVHLNTLVTLVPSDKFGFDVANASHYLNGASVIFLRSSFIL